MIKQRGFNLIWLYPFGLVDINNDILVISDHVVPLYLLETAYFTSKQSKKLFSSIEKCSSIIKVPQFLYCHYMYM